MRRLSRACAFVFSAAAVLLVLCTPVRAGTTGTVSGRVVESQSGAPVAGAAVTATSPSQSATAKTDANGTFSFVSLAPDTYVVSVTREGYDPLSQSGVTVQSDQVQNLRLTIVRTIKTIGSVTARAGDLVRPGTTSDIYSINPALAAATQVLGGSGSLNQSYGAVASVPGTVVAQGQQGWYQTLSIRGGDIDQVGYELDGIPVNRSYDNAPQTMLSALGQQELQVYTGGTPASADASGISGYVNQVIKTGTSPGFVNINISGGAPGYYHQLSVEFGGVSKDKNFSYYVGLAGADQGFRYLDQFNGPLDTHPSFFYPLNIPSNNGFVWDGSAQPTFAPGNSYAFATTNDREVIANLHLGIPHNGLRDDVQLLFLSSQILGYYNSSVNDLGGPNIVQGAVNGGSPIPWSDGYLYTGKVFAPVQSGAVQQYFFPGSGRGTGFNSDLPLDQRDGNNNGVNILKLQYQRNIDQHSFLRLYGFDLWSTWFITGPLSAYLPYGAEVADYEIPNHTFGTNLSYTNQIDAKNLLNISASWNTSKLQRYSTTGGFPGNTQNPNRDAGAISNWIDSKGNCYDPNTGAYASCFANSLRGNMLNPTLPVTAPAGSPGVVNGANWIVTENGNHANLNNVTPYFSAVSLSDQVRPTDRLSASVGLRVENYAYRLADTASAYPARAFWFAAYNRENCFGSGLTAPVGATLDPATGLTTCPAGTTNTALVNASGGTISSTVWQPRLGATYSLNPDTVLRASWGLYARPENSSWLQYNTTQQNLASFLGSQFLTYGFTTPRHDLRPDTSSNYDASLEYHVHNSDVSLKVTPFLRTTQNQLQNFNISALTGLFSGLNVGRQQSYGMEFLIRKGDFARDGLSGQFAYTYTHSRIQYNDFANSSSNIIDTLNSYIQQYNSYTSACGSAGANTAQCGKTNPANGANGAPCFDLSGNPLAAGQCVPSTSVANPYYNAKPQPLLDRNGQYTTYDIIPAPFAGANGYETPNVASLVLNYKYKQFTVTPTLTYSSGAKYGSPLVWPGYVPQGCTATLAGSTAADTTKCTGNGPSPFGLPYLFTPDKYSGNFDTLGAFNQPQRITVNATLGYEYSKTVKFVVALTGLVDACIQRGYAWDNAYTCVYSSLPSSILAPAGNYVTTNVPEPLKYPYAVWSNNSNTGFVGTQIPFQAIFEAQIRL